MKLSSRISRLERSMDGRSMRCREYAEQWARIVTDDGEAEPPWSEEEIAEFAIAVEDAGGPWTHEEALKLIESEDANRP